MKKQKQNFRKLTLVFALLLVFAVQSAFATNGYFSHGYGTQSKGMAGAGIALPLGNFGSANNPASMAFVPQGYQLGIAAFMPAREYTVEGTSNTSPLSPGKVESDSKFFPIPSLGANWILNDVNAINVALYGNGGMNTDYDTKTFNNPMVAVTQPTGVNLSQMFLGLTYARKLAEKHSLGVSAIVAYQRFEAKGLQIFAGSSSDPNNLTDNDPSSSMGYGFKVGYMGDIHPMFSVGASYQSKIMMGEFKEYAGLFAEEGDFDIPATWTAGVAVKPNEKLTVAIDVQQILYSGVKSLNNPMSNMTVNGKPLGDKDGAGFGWEDMMVYKLGLAFSPQEICTWRLGYSFGEQPIPESEVMFNILAPGVIEQHVTLGYSRTIKDKKAIHFALTHAFSNTVEGQNPFDPTQTIELKMNQLEFEVGFSF